MAFPVTSVLDNFNRADGAVGASWAGPGWGSPNGLTISSNQAMSAGAGEATMCWATTLSGDLEVYTAFPVKPDGTTSIRLLLLDSPTSSTPNGYSLRVQMPGNNWTIYKITAGAESSLGNVASGITFANNDSVGFEKIGSALTGYYKASGGSWASELTQSDGTYSPTYIGVDLTNNVPRIDDFGGGTVGGAAPGPPIPQVITARR